MRIVAGRYGGRRIAAPRGEATRPTSDRVREAVFSVLGPLDGLRVLDLSAYIAGPYGCSLLADQGADVIKVEAPEGDMVRHIGKPAKTPGMGPTYLYVNRNKRSLCLDLKNPAAKAALLNLSTSLSRALAASPHPQSAPWRSP